MVEIVRDFGYWVHDLGAWGYPIAVLLMTAVAIIPFPAEIPAAMNGMLFGPLGGTIITWSGGLLGAQISFELSRRFGRPIVERILPAGALARVDRAVRTVSWPGLLTVRLIPAVAFTALNWGIGLTLCRRRTFLWTTALGILPGTIIFVSSGEGLARLYARHPALAVALLALLTGAFIIVSRRRGAADEAAAEPDSTT